MILFFYEFEQGKTQKKKIEKSSRVATTANEATHEKQNQSIKTARPTATTVAPLVTCTGTRSINKKRIQILMYKSCA